MYDNPRPPRKFSGMTQKTREKSQIANPLSSPRFALRTNRKQFYMVRNVQTYFYLRQMHELGTSGPNLQLPYTSSKSGA